jgi:hypothetical protein
MRQRFKRNETIQRPNNVWGFDARQCPCQADVAQRELQGSLAAPYDNVFNARASIRQYVAS